MVTVLVIVLLVVCLSGGLYAYLHRGPDVRSDVADRQRLERKLAKNRTIEKAEEEFQRRQRENGA